MLVSIVSLLTVAFAEAPRSLDELVETALGRDPSAFAVAYEADAARIRADAASRWMDPQWMVGTESLGVMKDSPDPTMIMVGVTQMFPRWGELGATQDAIFVDASRLEVDRRRIAADLRLRLWQLVAEIDALQQETRLIDTQITSAVAIRDIAIARYGSGASTGMQSGSRMNATPDMPSPEGMDMGGQSLPVARASSVGSGMSAMSGMGSSGPPAGGVSVPSPDASMGEAMSTRGMSAMASGQGLAAILLLDAEVARLEAERAAIEARLAGQGSVLSLYVGDESSAVVLADPDTFFGGPIAEPAPELELAVFEQARAEAQVALVRAQRNPDLMVSVGQRFMPAENMMPEGTDIAIGLGIPLWGSRGRYLDAARVELDAAEARADSVRRDLKLAQLRAAAALRSALARSESLETAAVPRTRAAWHATESLFANNVLTAEDAVRAWQSWIFVEREAVLAKRDVQFRMAELARLGATTWP